jgi:hypothetical protein
MLPRDMCEQDQLKVDPAYQFNHHSDPEYKKMKKNYKFYPKNPLLLRGPFQKDVQM